MANQKIPDRNIAATTPFMNGDSPKLEAIGPYIGMNMIQTKNEPGIPSTVQTVQKLYNEYQRPALDPRRMAYSMIAPDFTSTVASTIV